MLIKMSKNKRYTRKRDRNFVAIPFQVSWALVTLGDGTVILQSSLSANFGEDIYIISMDVTFSILGLTVGEGPISIGMSHGDLSLTEVSEYLDSEMTDPDDIIAKERGRRPVRRMGAFSGVSANESLFNGVPKRYKILFSIGNDHALNLWARNLSGAALTTGATVKCQGTIFGRWQR